MKPFKAQKKPKTDFYMSWLNVTRKPSMGGGTLQTMSGASQIFSEASQ